MVKRRFWSKDEDAYLISNYEGKTNKEIANELGRTEDSIKNRARKLGIRKTSHFWTEEEDEVIRTTYPEWGAQKCQDMLPNRTKQAICKRAEELGIECDLITQRQNLGLRAHDMPKGFYVGTQGYLIYTPTGNTEDRMYYHRYKMEQHIGRKLESSEIVHHIDEDKTNNDINNLQIMTRAEHAIHHHGDLSSVRDSPTPREIAETYSERHNR